MMTDFLLNTEGLKFDGEPVPPEIKLEDVVDTKVDHPSHYTTRMLWKL